MKIKRKLATGVCSLAIVAATAVPALATVVNVGGGTWNYGVNNNGGEVWSSYHHPTKKHRSSVINGYGEYQSSACLAAGKWTWASLRAHPNKVDHAYWSNSCT